MMYHLNHKETALTVVILEPDSEFIFNQTTQESDLVHSRLSKFCRGLQVLQRGNLTRILLARAVPTPLVHTTVSGVLFGP